MTRPARSRLDKSPHAPHGGIGSAAPENRRDGRPGASNAPEAPPEAPELDEQRQELLDAIVVSNEFPRPDGLEKAEDVAIARWLADLNELEISGMLGQLEEERRTRMSEEVAASMGMARNSPMYDAVMDIRRQRDVESKVEPIGMMNLFLGKIVRQVVPYNDQITITVQTVSTLHVEWLHRMASEELSAPTQSYFQEWFSRRRVCLAIYAVGGDPFNHGVENFNKEEHYGKFKEAVSARILEFGRMPEQLFEELRAHAIWYDVRIRKALAGNPARKLGN